MKLIGKKKKFLGYTLLNSHPTTDLYMIRLMIYSKPAIFHSVLITKQCIINTTRNREREIGSIKSDSTKQDSSWCGGKSMLTFWPKEEEKKNNLEKRNILMSF